MVWDSTTMQAQLSPARIESILTAVARVKGRSLTVKQFQRLLGLMAAAFKVTPFGLLHMRPLQWWLKTKGFFPEGESASHDQGHGMMLSCLRHVEETLVLVTRPRVGRSQHIGGLLYQPPGGLRSHPLYKLANQILLWSQDKLLSLRVIYIPGSIINYVLYYIFYNIKYNLYYIYLNTGADILSRQGPRPGEWMLHPEVVKQIWRVFDQAKVDLFAAQEISKCPLLTHSAPLGLDAIVQTWPRLRLYALPPIVLLPGVLERVRWDGVHLLLVALFWSDRVWFSDLISLIDGSPWETPVRRYLLSQVGGHHLSPLPGVVEAVGVAP